MNAKVAETGGALQCALASSPCIVAHHFFPLAFAKVALRLQSCRLADGRYSAP